jgi:phosphatidylglycerophosphate synthase
MVKIIKTISELRKEQYEYNSEVVPYINHWKQNPYTFLKARFYMEVSAILVWFLLKAKIKPNTVTIFYGLAGIIGGALLSIPYKWTILAALFIFFTKGILDWSDGHLARATRQTSLMGHILDVYGALLNDLGLQIGLGFYVALKTDCVLFYYLIPLIPFCYAAGLKSFSEKILFQELLKKEFIKCRMQRFMSTDKYNAVPENVKIGVMGPYRKYYVYFSSFLDANARSVDFICFLILLEMFTDISVTWLVFIALVIKGFILFAGGLYIAIKKDSIEKSLDATMYNIKKSLENDR